MKKKENTRLTSYDDAHRTMLTDCPELILPVLNEVFGTRYESGEEVFCAG